MSEVRVNNLSNENNTSGPTISGITTYSGRHFFVPPKGTTAERPENCEPGSLRFNTDSARLEYFRGNTIGWTEIEASNVEMSGVSGSSGSIEGRGTRAIFAGGYAPSGTTPNATMDTVDAFTVETLGNSIDFNNLSSTRGASAGCADATRSFCLGGVGPVLSQYSTVTNIIEFCIFSSTADFVDFGDLSDTQGYQAGFADKTRGVVAGGGFGYTNVIEYITMQSSGNTVDFGDTAITNKIGNAGGLSSSTRGYILGGARYLAPDTASFNTIQVVTISTTGDATDFGDMLYANYSHGAASNAIRGVKGSGYGPNYTSRIEFLTLSSSGDMVYFGDLTSGGGSNKQAAASPTRMVIGGGYVAPATPFANTLEFVQIATTGDSTDFGDLSSVRRARHNTSNNHGGL